MAKANAPKLSVVVATYNRGPSLCALLEDLARQDIGADQFEVVLIDDGSKVPAWSHVARLTLPYPLHHTRQENAGAAAARQRGVEQASGEIVVILDDDMHIEPGFLRAHLKAHEAGADVVLGHIHAPDDEAERALHERFHMDTLKKFVRGFRDGSRKPRGVNLCTGNVSFPRQLFLKVGGFDPSLKRSEDRELGVRFEAAGANIVFAEDAISFHKSDHDSLERWLSVAFNYGIYDRKISKKHEAMESADPWRFIFQVNPISRPLLLLSAFAPTAGKQLSKAAVIASEALDERGLQDVALKGLTLVYGLEYFRGMREDAGSPRALLKDFARYLRKRTLVKEADPLTTFAVAVTEDFSWVQKYGERYSNKKLSFRQLPAAAVTKVGFQMMCATRAMGLAKGLGLPLVPKVASRLIRHLYAAEIHWDAQLDPGITIVHGNGIVLSHAAKIGPGCILFHNVTLGVSIHPETREVGAPTLEENVHVGPGATLLGPITIGRGSKIMAGAVVTRSVPPGSVVRTPEPELVQREKSALRAVKKKQRS